MTCIMEVWTLWGCLYGKGSIEISMIRYVSCFFPIQIILNIPRNRWFTRKFTHITHDILIYVYYFYSSLHADQGCDHRAALPDLPGAERPAEETHPKVQSSGCDTYINNISIIYTTNIWILSTYQESRGYFIEIYTKGMYCDGWIWKNTIYKWIVEKT